MTRPTKLFKSPSAPKKTTSLRVFWLLKRYCVKEVERFGLRTFSKLSLLATTLLASIRNLARVYD